MVNEHIPTVSELDSRLRAAEDGNAQLRVQLELFSDIAARLEAQLGRMEREQRGELRRERIPPPVLRGSEWIDGQLRIIERRKALRR